MTKTNKQGAKNGSKPNVLNNQNLMSIDVWRFKLLWFVVALVFAALLGRAFMVQVLDRDFLQKKANARILSTERVQAQRGDINDRNGIPLAISTPVMSIVIDPKDYFDNKALFEKNMQALAENPNDRNLQRKLLKKNLDLNALADMLGMERNELIRRVYAKPKSRYLLLKREVPPQQANLILNQRFQGVYTQKQYKRYYPQPQPNAQIIGLTNNEGLGVEGLEKQFNHLLKGQDGEQKISRDQKGNRLKVEDVIQKVEAGQSLNLSIDSRLQYIMYRELAAAGIANNARSASAVAVDVKTGEILAMSNWPSYNPNDRKNLNTQRDAMRNRGAVDVFEPGSTMKPLTIAMALESGQYHSNSIINTAPGFMRIGNYTIRDTHNYGSLNLAGIIIKSSNVGVAKIALSLPYENLPTFYQRLGFGQKTAVGFLGEAAGTIKDPKNWRQSEIATMSYGYGIDVSLLQLVQAYAILANNGKKLPLSLSKLQKPPQAVQVIDPKIANQVLLMMEGVTQPGGTALQAAIPGFRVAGKTGTARKVLPGRGYSTKEYRALFAGIVPVSNPRLAIVVVVENPQGAFYGGVVAAPVFARIAEDSLRLMNVPLDKPLYTPQIQ